jgi:ParB-like chromosome segregation protein Spo0J
MKKAKIEGKQPVTEPGSLNIEYRSLDDLVPYAKNPRTHSEEQISQIAASIQEFGFTNPILIDGNRRVIAGHGRLAAAKELGMETVPCIDLSHMTEGQKRAYIIADNKIALNGGWNEDLLRVELTALKELGADLQLTGFDVTELADIMLGKDVEFKEYDRNARVVRKLLLPLGAIWFARLVPLLSQMARIGRFPHARILRVCPHFDWKTLQKAQQSWLSR